MARKRFTKVGFNTKLIVDVVAASLIVQKAPGLINMIFPLDPSIATVAGVGAGYLVGSVMKRPDLANASIALGAVDFIAPLLDGILGSDSSSTKNLPGGTQAITNVKAGRMEDYISLNDYVADPSKRLGYLDYMNSY
jgi:hypothetical protein